MSKGWIKLHRSIADHPRFQDQKWLIVWIKCLTLATHKPYPVVFSGKVIELQKGQFITSRKSLSEKTGVSESTVERILTTLENEQQIGQQSSSVSRLITVTNWIEYQDGEQEDEQQTDSGRTAGGQRADTNKNEKNEKNEKEGERSPAPSRKEILAGKILTYWKRKVSKDTPTDQTLRSIQKCLENFDQYDLCWSIRAYSHEVEDKREKDPDYKLYKGSNFFGQKAYFKDYLPTPEEKEEAKPKIDSVLEAGV